jgi:hypothetical protein
VNPVVLRSGRRRRRVLRALVVLVLLVVVVPPVCVELGYQIEIARIPERPPSPVPPLPRLLVQSLAVQLFDTAEPEMTTVYPWTPFVALARMKARARPRLTPEALAASETLRQSTAVRTKMQRMLDRAVLATWISRHLSANEALRVALWQMSFGRDLAGIDAAARRFFGKSAQDLDAGEIAELLAVSQYPAIVEHPERLRESRDDLLRKLHAYGVIDESTMAATMERDVRRFK